MRRFWVVAVPAVLGGLWLAGRAAPVVAAEVTTCAPGGPGPASASVVWSYGPGVRPLSLVIDVDAGPASGSLSIDGFGTNAEVPLDMPFQGGYTLVVTASYRLLGLPATRVYTFMGSVAPAQYAPAA